jgi:hypothetical protein
MDQHQLECDCCTSSYSELITGYLFTSKHGVGEASQGMFAMASPFISHMWSNVRFSSSSTKSPPYTISSNQSTVKGVLVTNIINASWKSANPYGNQGNEGVTAWDRWDPTHSSLLIETGIDVLPGLLSHLQANFPPLYKLWERMKERNEVPLEEEILVARGERDIKSINLDTPLASSDPIVDLFCQAERSSVSLIQSQMFQL